MPSITIDLINGGSSRKALKEKNIDILDKSECHTSAFTNDGSSSTAS